MAGSPPRTNVHQTPGTRSPGYGWSQGFFNSLPGVGQNPYPTYQGNLDPGMSPTMQSMIRQAQAYSQAGPPEILQGAAGSLGRFMTPNFINPAFRVGGGFTYPNYFPSYGDTRMYGGMTGAQANPAGSPFPVGGGGMGTPMPKMDYGPGKDLSTLLAGMRPGGQGGPQVQGQQPYFAQRGPALAGGAYTSGGQPDFAALPGPPTGTFGGQVPGAQTAWDMGALKNRGMVHGGQIWVGGGGGETGQWQPYDPNNLGMRQSAEMFNRYGSNWSSGSGATGAHFSEMAPWLKAALGRDPTQQEQTDLYYGVGATSPQAAKAAFAAQSAAFDPSSSSYDPNARYTSAAYRGPKR
jgi:hypothetical protein